MKIGLEIGIFQWYTFWTRRDCIEITNTIATGIPQSGAVPARAVRVCLHGTVPYVLAYRTPCNLAQSLLELADFVSTALLRSPRLLVLGDFNIHTQAEVSGPAHEFLETMASLDLIQQVNGSTHMGGHMLDLVFAAEQRVCAPMVANLVSALSWSDHHLIKCGLSVALPSHGVWTH